MRLNKNKPIPRALLGNFMEMYPEGEALIFIEDKTTYIPALKIAVANASGEVEQVAMSIKNNKGEDISFVSPAAAITFWWEAGFDTIRRIGDFYREEKQKKPRGKKAATVDTSVDTKVALDSSKLNNTKNRGA